MRTSRLPRWVDFRPGAEVYNAHNSADLRTLALALLDLSGAKAITVAASLVEQRVMYPPAIHRFAAWVAVKRGQDERMFWAQVYSNPRFGQQMTDALLTETARWMVEGKDREDPRSAGGFSQREINFIAGVLSIVGAAAERENVR